MDCFIGVATKPEEEQEEENRQADVFDKLFAEMREETTDTPPDQDSALDAIFAEAITPKKVGRPAGVPNKRCPRHDIDTIADLPGKYRQIARLATLGMKNVEIAERVGVANSTVTAALNTPAVKKQIVAFEAISDKKHVEGPLTRLHNMQDKAVDVLEEALEDMAVDSDKRARIALNVLGIGGIAPVQKVQREERKVVVNTTIQEMIEEAKARTQPQEGC